MRLAPALATAAILTTAITTACTPGGASTPPPTVVTVTATAPAPPAETSPTPADTPSSEAAERKKLPDVTGMNLQAAQDHLQAADFWVLNDKDATGQNRLQVLDRNWQVVRQTPAAGKRIPTDTLITLYAKKIGE
jgi:hypothetical protein